MAKKVTVLKAEEAALRDALAALALDIPGGHATLKGLAALLAKLDAPKPEPKESGLPLSAIEVALGYSKKYAPWLGNPARQLKTLHEANATLEQLERVARWADRQGWLDRFTLQSVANSWGSWLSQAMAGPVAKGPRPGVLVGFEEYEE